MCCPAPANDQHAPGPGPARRRRFEPMSGPLLGPSNSVPRSEVAPGSWTTRQVDSAAVSRGFGEAAVHPEVDLIGRLVGQAAMAPPAVGELEVPPEREFLDRKGIPGHPYEEFLDTHKEFLDTHTDVPTNELNPLAFLGGCPGSCSQAGGAHRAGSERAEPGKPAGSGAGRVALERVLAEGGKALPVDDPEAPITRLDQAGVLQLAYRPAYRLVR